MTAHSPLVVIGKLLRPHGIPREGVSHFKIGFDSPGHHSLPLCSSVWISTPQGFRELPLAEVPSPLGAKWSQAIGAKVGFHDKDLETLGHDVIGREIALERQRFEKIADHEVYLCDLVGSEVRDANAKSYGRIVAAHAAGPGSWNLEVKKASELSFEFPLKWIDWSASSVDWNLADARFVVVPGIEVWASIDEIEGERDDD